VLAKVTEAKRTSAERPAAALGNWARTELLERRYEREGLGEAPHDRHGRGSLGRLVPQALADRHLLGARIDGDHLEGELGFIGGRVVALHRRIDPGWRAKRHPRLARSSHSTACSWCGRGNRPRRSCGPSGRWRMPLLDGDGALMVVPSAS